MAQARKSNVPINYAEQLAAEASDITRRIAAPTGDRIRFNSNRSFITPDGLEGEELEVVVLDFMSSNVFYEGIYDRDNPQPPACFSIGPEPSTLVPSPSSPNRQADTCASCPNNQFGSAITGKGKACKNTRLIAVTPATVLEDEEQQADAPIWIMAIPPTSLKAFDSYVSSLATKHRRIPIGVVTRVTMDPGSTYAAPRFSIVRPLENDELGICMPMRESAQQRLTVEPDVSQYTPPAANKGARRR